VEAQRRLIEQGVDGFYAGIARKSHADVDEWQTQMQLKPMRAGSVHLFAGGLGPVERGLTGVDVVDQLQETVERCVAQSGDASLAVIPEGPYVVPVYQPG
jgi:hypothetical protein